MSELAHVLAQIDLEVESINRIFQGPSIMASHATITARMERLWGWKEQLDPYFAGQEDESTRQFLSRLERLDPHPIHRFPQDMPAVEIQHKER